MRQLPVLTSMVGRGCGAGRARAERFRTFATYCSNESGAGGAGSRFSTEGSPRFTKNSDERLLRRAAHPAPSVLPTGRLRRGPVFASSTDG